MIAEYTPLGWAYTGRTGIMEAGNVAARTHATLGSYHAQLQETTIWIQPKDIT